MSSPPSRASAVALGASIASFVFVATVAATPGSPFTPILPPGAGPGGPFRWLAGLVGLDAVHGTALAAVGGPVALWHELSAFGDPSLLRLVDQPGLLLSLVFVAGSEPFVALTSGPNRADTDRLSELAWANFGHVEIIESTVERNRSGTGGSAWWNAGTPRVLASTVARNRGDGGAGTRNNGVTYVVRSTVAAKPANSRHCRTGRPSRSPSSSSASIARGHDW